MSAPPVFQSAPLAIKYRAFISYAHADTRETRWLHKQLEAFKIDRDLVGRPTPGGPIPKSLRPIFRDRDDFTAGHTLSGQTLAALDASAALIVICSPACAKSHYVNEEIRLFKQHHPDRPVIPVIIAGRPASSPLPVPLRGEGRDSGARSVTGVEGEGQQQAKVALWATPHALPAAAPHPDPLPMPEQSMGIGDDIECFPPALRFLVDANGTITASPAEVLAADIRDDGDGRALAVAKVVASLIGVSTDEVRKRQEIAWRRTTTIASRLAKGDPGNAGWQRHLSVSYEKVGDVWKAQGNLPEALKSYRDSREISERLAKADPGNAGWQRDLAINYQKLGLTLQQQGSRDDALANFRSGSTIMTRLTALSPDNAIWKSDAAFFAARIAKLEGK